MTFEIDLKERKAVVTGGGSGIGKASVLALAMAGADVAFTYLESNDSAYRVAEEVKNLGREAFPIKCDVTDLKDVDSLKEQAVSSLGGIDILVNNAGAALARVPFLEAEDELWQRSFQLNVMGVFRCCRAFLPQMIAKKFGRVINISSLAATNGGIPNSLHYASMKGAVNTMTIGLANQFSPMGITVNAIAPGIIDTPFQVKTPGIDFEKAARSMPAGRVGVPSDIAPMVVYLSSDYASLITGEIYHIDGGKR